MRSSSSARLRSPLAVILGNCQLVEENGYRPDQTRKVFEVIKRQGERMNKMVEELLDRYRRDRAGAPTTEIGDLVVLGHSGAYGLSVAMVGFLSHPIAPEHFLTS